MLYVVRVATHISSRRRHSDIIGQSSSNGGYWLSVTRRPLRIPASNFGCRSFGFGKPQLLDPTIESVVTEVPVSGDNVDGVVIDERQKQAYVLSTTRGDLVRFWVTVVELCGGA